MNFEQEQFYGKATFNMSRAVVTDHIVEFTALALGSPYHSAIKSGFNDTNTDLATRYAFKVMIFAFHCNICIDLGYDIEDSHRSGVMSLLCLQYGCIRGVYGTPFFFVNGFPLANAGSPLNYTGWRKVLDPLLR